MKVLSLAARKGGVGKSTLATSLAVAASQAGERVALVDLDDQGSVRSWGRRRQTRDIRTEAAQPAGLRPLLTRLQADSIGLVIIDTPGITSPGVAVALQASDFCLMALRPSLVDVETASATVAQLKTLKVPFGLVLNAANPTTSGRTLDAAHAIATFGVISPIAISSRVDFADAMANGLGPTEINPQGKAAAEVTTLWHWVQERMRNG